MLRGQQGRLGDLAAVAVEGDLAGAEPVNVGVWARWTVLPAGSKQEPERLWLPRALLAVVHGGGGWPHTTISFNLRRPSQTGRLIAKLRRAVDTVRASSSSYPQPAGWRMRAAGMLSCDCQLMAAMALVGSVLH